MKNNTGTQDSQLAYLENNLPEELFDTATGRAWVNTWNQDTRVLFYQTCTK